MPPPALSPPAFKLRDGAATARPEKQNSSAIGWCHLPQLRPQTLIIRIGLTTSLPRQFINLLRPTLHTLLRLQLQIELHSFFQPFTSRLSAFPRSSPTTNLKHTNSETKEQQKSSNKRKGKLRKLGGGMRQENRQRVENVREIWGYKESTRKQNENEDKKVKGCRWRVFTEKGIARARVCWSLGFGNWRRWRENWGRRHGGGRNQKIAHVIEKAQWRALQKMAFKIRAKFRDLTVKKWDLREREDWWRRRRRMAYVSEVVVTDRRLWAVWLRISHAPRKRVAKKTQYII